MYHKIFIRKNDEIKDNKFDMQFSLHNITHEEIQKYMFILLLNDLCSNIVCDYFLYPTGTEMFIYFEKEIPEIVSFLKTLFFVLLNDLWFTYLLSSSRVDHL